MPKSIEDIDRQIAALKEQKKRQQAQIAQKKREGLRSCKELISLCERVDRRHRGAARIGNRLRGNLLADIISHVECVGSFLALSHSSTVYHSTVVQLSTMAISRKGLSARPRIDPLHLAEFSLIPFQVDCGWCARSREA